jgi:hypothetical protein
MISLFHSATNSAGYWKNERHTGSRNVCVEEISQSLSTILHRIPLPKLQAKDRFFSILAVFWPKPISK